VLAGSGHLLLLCHLLGFGDGMAALMADDLKARLHAPSRVVARRHASSRVITRVITRVHAI
jgi:hypothetical protein